MPIQRFPQLNQFKVLLQPIAGDAKKVDLGITKVEWTGDDLLLIRGMQPGKSLVDQLEFSPSSYRGDKGLANWLVISIDGIPEPIAPPSQRRGFMDTLGAFDGTDMYPSIPVEPPEPKPARLWAVIFEKVIDRGFLSLDTTQKDMAVMETVQLVKAELFDSEKMKLKTKPKEG